MRLTKLFSAAVAFLAHQTHAIGNNETRDCTVHDDPHFTDFFGQFFDFQSGCDVRLVEGASISGQGLDIILRLKALNGYSTIAAVGVRIGGDLLQVTDEKYKIGEVSSPETFNVSWPFHPTNANLLLGDQDLSVSTDPTNGMITFKIELPTVGGEDHYIAINVYPWGELTPVSMSIRIHGHGSVFSSSKGLCGDWDETIPGYYAPNGTGIPLVNPPFWFTFVDGTQFGNAWRTENLQGYYTPVPPPSEWSSTACVPQAARRRNLQDTAKRNLEECQKCKDLDQSGAPPVQVERCKYDAKYLSCDYVSIAPQYDQSNSMFADIYPPSSAGGGGDPHLKTFFGHAYSYHGQCDMVLLQSRDFASGTGLDIHIRTTRVDKAKVGYSYISGAAMKLGSDVLEVMEDGKLIVNGEDVSDPVSFAGYPLSKTFKGTHKKIIIYDLDVTTDKAISKPIQIRVNTNAGMLFVDVFGRFPDSAGLLGPPSDDKRMLARDGVTDLFDEWNSFGEEWQVRSDEPKLFQEDRAPQYPQGCVYESSVSTSLRRRLSMDSTVTAEEAEVACSGSKGISKEFCIADVMATGMLDLAEDEFYV